MSISSVIDVSVNLATRTVTRQGFGIPLILGYHTVFPESVRVYSSLSAMITDGFAATDPEYRAAAAIAQQSPRPVSWYVGRRDNTFTHSVTLIPTVLTEGYQYKLTISDGVTTESAIYTVLAGDVLGDVISGLGSAITALSLAVSTTASPVDLIVAADNAGKVFDYHVEGVQGDTALTIENTTTATGLSTDIATIDAASDAWYALLLTSHGNAEIEAAATAIQGLSTKRILLAATQDSDVKGSGSSDVASTIFAANRSRTGLTYHERPEGQWPAAAWAGRILPEVAGSVTWAWKALTGVTASALTDTEQANLRAKQCNFYVDFGLPITLEGWVSDATIDYIDIQRGIDWLQVNLQADLIDTLASAGKVPYTDSGIQMLRGIILRRLQGGVDNGFLVEGTPEVSVPERADVSTSDLAARRLTGVTFQAQVAGAVHGLTVAGSLYL